MHVVLKVHFNGELTPDYRKFNKHSFHRHQTPARYHPSPNSNPTMLSAVGLVFLALHLPFGQSSFSLGLNKTLQTHVTAPVVLVPCDTIYSNREVSACRLSTTTCGQCNQNLVISAATRHPHANSIPL